MTTVIAPPAAFGSLYNSTAPAALEQIFDELDLASLEQELFRLENAIRHLVQSNKEIQEFIAQDQEESEGDQQEPDPEFVLAIEENKQVISKYERTCVALRRAIQKKRSASLEGSCARMGPATGQEMTEGAIPGSDQASAGETDQEEGVFL